MHQHDPDDNFRRYCEKGDAAALARAFDVLAPRLLLLAAHVAHDAAEAEDLVQTTFLEALRDAATWDGRRPVGVWLAGILRHRAIDRRRTAQHERRTAGDTELDTFVGRERDPLEILADDELHRRLVAAILDLEEPYRQAVHLRLVNGLAPLEIARALGRPPGTVRMQLSRGLEKLRAALPNAEALLGGAFGAVVIGEGTRGLGAVRGEVLAAARAPAAATAAAGVALLSASSAWIGGVVLIVALAVGVWWNHFSASGSIEPVSVLGETMAPRGTGPAVAPLAPNSSDTRTPVVAVHTDDTVAPSAGPHTYTGHILAADGAPIAGAELYHYSRNATQQTTTDAAGGFALAVTGAVDASDALYLVAARRTPHTWLVDRTQDSDTTALGDLVLPPGGRILGRLVDADGEPIALAVDIQYIFANALRGVVTTDAESGTFELVDVIEGAALVFEAKNALLATKRATCSAHIGETTEVVLVHRGPSPLGRVALRTHTDFVGEGTRPHERSVYLVAPNGSKVDPKPAERESERRRETFFFDAVGSDEYELVIEDPRFERTVVPGVRGGQDRRVALVGSARVALDARAPEMDVVIEAPRVQVHLDADWTAGWTDLAFERTPTGWLSAPLPATVANLRIAALGRRVIEVAVEPELAFGEVRELRIELPPVGSIVGRVVDASGAARVGVDLVLAQSPPDDVVTACEGRPDLLSRWRNGAARRVGTSGVDGTFNFDNLEHIYWDLTAMLGGRPAILGKGLPIDGAPIDLVVPSIAALNGRVTTRHGALPAGLSVSVVRVVEPGAPLEPRRSELSRRLDADGRFSFEELESGRFDVVLEAPTLYAPSGGRVLDGGST